MDRFELSKHSITRMKQRGISRDEIAFILNNGADVDGGVLLTAQVAAEIEREARRTLALASKLRGKFVATEGSVVKTTFKASRKQQSRLLERRL